MIATPRPAAQATASGDVSPALSPARLTGAPLPRAGTTGASSLAAGLTVDWVSSPARFRPGPGRLRPSRTGSERAAVIDEAPPPPVAAFLVGVMSGLLLAAMALAVIEAVFGA